MVNAFIKEERKMKRLKSVYPTEINVRILKEITPKRKQYVAFYEVV